MDNMKIIEKLVLSANEKLKEIQNYYNKLDKSIFDYTDLKLHDLSFYLYDDFKNDFGKYVLEQKDYTEQSDFDNLFNGFCNMYFETFKDELANTYNIYFDDNTHYIGRTSKFYCFENDNYIDDFLNVLEYLYNENYNNAYLQFINVDNSILIDLESIKWEFENLEYYDKDRLTDSYINELTYIISGDFYNDFILPFENAKTLLKVIKEYKDNSIEYFKSWFYENI